jgi:hypothetical protein
MQFRYEPIPCKTCRCSSAVIQYVNNRQASLLVAAVCHGIGYNPRVDWNALMERVVDIGPVIIE